VGERVERPALHPSLLTPGGLAKQRSQRLRSGVSHGAVSKHASCAAPCAARSRFALRDHFPLLVGQRLAVSCGRPFGLLSRSPHEKAIAKDFPGQVRAHAHNDEIAAAPAASPLVHGQRVAKRMRGCTGLTSSMWTPRCGVAHGASRLELLAIGLK